MTAILERRAFRPIVEISVPSIRILPERQVSRVEIRGERRE